MGIGKSQKEEINHGNKTTILPPPPSFLPRMQVNSRHIGSNKTKLNLINHYYSINLHGEICPGVSACFFVFVFYDLLFKWEFQGTSSFPLDLQSLGQIN